MTDNTELIEKLWKDFKFTPNPAQREAILYFGKKPLFITAAPGSGKTRVLLWRTVYLIACKGVSPDNIFLSTFTEKAAHQLKEGLKELLGAASNLNDQKYDLARMYVGTIHSNCHRILSDRNFSADGSRQQMPSIMDELGQYLYVYRSGFWKEMLKAAGLKEGLETHQKINQYFSSSRLTRNSQSRHYAAVGLIKCFNRLSEELANPKKLKSKDPLLDQAYEMYRFYIGSLSSGPVRLTDLSLVQAEALNAVQNSPKGGHRFDHVIIDEYQDTNTVQERLVFALGEGKKNLCVVGDDDQALYRFRGATVENFVEFPERCQAYYKVNPSTITLHTNYRSLNPIVEVSQAFMNQTSWNHGKKSYRISKDVAAHRKEKCPAVFVTDEGMWGDVLPTIAKLVKRLKAEGRITDYNQAAVLFSYLKGNPNVERMKEAFEKEGIPVYAPRAGRFLDLDESLAVFGLMGAIFGMPKMDGFGRDMDSFRAWGDQCTATVEKLMKADPALKKFVTSKQEEIQTTIKDHKKLNEYCDKKSIPINSRITLDRLHEMAGLSGLSSSAARRLKTPRMQSLVKSKLAKVTYAYVINRTTSLDWGLLDLFYHFTAFSHFRALIDKAANGEDEGPICNLGLLTEYISRYQEKKGRPIITASDVVGEWIQKDFFMAYLYAMYRLGETEFENEEDPFPKGRVSFITIHQAKGLEFPVVILGSLYRREEAPDIMESIVRESLGRDGEPLARMVEFDNARLFYVALSRAKNILLLPRLKRQPKLDAFNEILDDGLPHMCNLNFKKHPPAEAEADDMLGQSYSYTTDYLMYKKCPRQYMLFRKYNFIPARSSVMLFGSLIHQTLEDLHNYLLAQRRTA